jgi:hypothetical protein
MRVNHAGFKGKKKSLEEGVIEGNVQRKGK